MVMPYHLHMPSYFLETFTEYPCFKGMLLCIGASLEKHFSFKIKNVIIYFGRVFVQLF